MSKLIYVDRLKKDILALQDCHNGFSDTYDKACIIGVIDEQPTIEERKTGRWIPRYDRPKQEVFICSECGGFAYSRWTGSRKTPKKNWCKYRFCPNCGADMRGEQDE